MTDPIRIVSAELVLYPANADFLANKPNEPAKLVVQRIVENWYDSSIAWDNLPMVDSASVAKEKIRIKGKNQEIRINVTFMVMDMIMYGNKGFMISPNNKALTDSLNGLSFASSLNDDKLLRPLLVITYNDGSYTPSQSQWPTRNRPVSAPVYTPPPRSSGGSGSSNKSE